MCILCAALYRQSGVPAMVNTTCTSVSAHPLLVGSHLWYLVQPSQCGALQLLTLSYLLHASQAPSAGSVWLNYVHATLAQHRLGLVLGLVFLGQCCA